MFKWISQISGAGCLAALRAGLLPLKEDGRLQSCRFGGLDAWIPGGLEAGGLDPEALEAGWLAGWLAGLDWSGFEQLADGRCSNTLDAQRGRRITFLIRPARTICNALVTF